MDSDRAMTRAPETLAYVVDRTRRHTINYRLRGGAWRHRTAYTVGPFTLHWQDGTTETLDRPPRWLAGALLPGHPAFLPEPVIAALQPAAVRAWARGQIGE
jgi:hypothetical protein